MTTDRPQPVLPPHLEITFSQAIIELSKTIPLFNAPESAKLRQAMYMSIEALRGLVELQQAVLDAGEHSILTG